MDRNEAIKIVKSHYPANKQMLNEALEFLIPELKKSEDKQSKKWILEYLYDGLRKSDEQFKGQFKAAIAWLEKQGEKEISEPNWCHHKVDLSNCSEEYRKAHYDGWNNCNLQHSQYRAELDDVVKCLINGMKFYYEDNEEATWGTDKWSMPVKYIIEVLEKQGKQKPKDKYTFNSIPRLLDMIEPTSRAKMYCQKLIDTLVIEGYTTDAKIVSDCLKKMNGEKVSMATMDEQKPVDKVKPKYKKEECDDILSFLDTLEVKEVDFEKIWKEYFKYRGNVATINVKQLAKHFFNLGLKYDNTEITHKK